MVQRKVPSKLGFQAALHVKSDKKLGNLKPSSCQHQDGKNTGPDMKKKMKRSRSIKLSDIESLNSSPMRKALSQPGKPPPSCLSAPTAAATPQKQSMIKTTGGSPNYMKATSSSEARKERYQVSSLNTPTRSDSKTLRRRNSSDSKLSSASSDKPSRSLTRSSSLKRVRTLTKTPSFKPARSATKKCSKVALCAEVNVQKATCSSTLKDSKFPAYLMLNPGGTEAEGTSVLKVCPFTYCSLNGHHHTPLPPLKSFLKAKRRSLKAQKSAKMEASSPCKSKPSVDETEEYSRGLLIFSGYENQQHEAYLIGSTNIPVVKDMGMDLFIEIYAKSAADCDSAEANEKHTEIDEGTTGFGGEHKEDNNEFSFHGDNEPVAEQDNRLLGAEVADPSLQLEIDYASTEEDDIISDVSDMEWEEGQFSTAEIHTEADYSNKPEREVCINVEYISESKQLDFPDEPKIFISDDMISNCTEEILADEVFQELFEEGNSSFDTQSQHSDNQMEGMPQNWGILEHSETNVDSSVEEPIAESAEVNENIQEDKVCGREYDAIEKISQLGHAKIDGNTSITPGDLNGQLEDKSLEAAEAVGLLQCQIVESSQGSEEGSNLLTSATSLQELPSNEAGDLTEEPEQAVNVELSTLIQNYDSSQRSHEEDQNDVELNDNQSHVTAEACQFAEESSSKMELVAEIKPDEHCNQPLDGQQESISVVDTHIFSQDDRNRANKFGTPRTTHSGEQNNLGLTKMSSAENDTREIEKMEVDLCKESDTTETFFPADNETSAQPRSRYLRKGSNSSQEISNICNRKWTIQRKTPLTDSGEEKSFNPREPNFLPVVPDPEAEKVDLKHQMMDDRKNSEEWMLDYALQQAVTKLAPARKRKVALLVEAFEAVLPVPKYETRIRNTPAPFSHARPIQACS